MLVTNAITKLIHTTHVFSTHVYVKTAANMLHCPHYNAINTINFCTLLQNHTDTQQHNLTHHCLRTQSQTVSRSHVTHTRLRSVHLSQSPFDEETHVLPMQRAAMKKTSQHTHLNTATERHCHQAAAILLRQSYYNKELRKWQSDPENSHARVRYNKLTQNCTTVLHASPYDCPWLSYKSTW